MTLLPVWKGGRPLWTRGLFGGLAPTWALSACTCCGSTFTDCGCYGDGRTMTLNLGGFTDAPREGVGTPADCNYLGIGVCQWSNLNGTYVLTWDGSGFFIALGTLGSCSDRGAFVSSALNYVGNGETGFCCPVEGDTYCYGISAFPSCALGEDGKPELTGLSLTFGLQGLEVVGTNSAINICDAICVPVDGSTVTYTDTSIDNSGAACMGGSTAFTAHTDSFPTCLGGQDISGTVSIS